MSQAPDTWRPYASPVETVDQDPKQDTASVPAHTAHALRVWRDGVVALIAVVASFVVLRPDWYYIQNGLDPLFYTGYTINFDDILPAIDDRHYFVSRWSLYLPGRAFALVFGATTGFIALRIALLAVAVGGVWHIGRTWPWSVRALNAAVLLTSPMLARSVYTDYSDAIVVPLGIVLIAALLPGPTSGVAAATAGAASAAMVIANPLAASIVVLTLVVWIALSRDDGRRTLARLSVLVGSAVIVVAAGLVLFRWRYGIADVYQPTAEFLRSTADQHDPLKSPDTQWLSFRLWIYLPLVTVAAAGALHWLRVSRLDRREIAMIVLCSAQYVFQWCYQFGFDGSTLEIPYYWSYMMPAYLVATCVVLRHLASLVSAPAVWALGCAIAVGTVAAGAPAPEVWPTVAASTFVVSALLVLTLSPVLRRRAPISALAAFILITWTVPFGSPRPEPRRAGELRVESSYDMAFGVTTSPGQRTFRAAIDFGHRLDRIGDDVERNLYFWLGSADSWQLAATYGAPVSGRAINVDATGAAGESLPPIWLERVHAGVVPVVAVLGAPAQVDTILGVIRNAGPPGLEILDDATFSSTRTTRMLLVRLVPVG